MEYLVTMTTHVPSGTSADEVADVRAREAAHTRRLANEGRVLRLWRAPLMSGQWRTIGLFSAHDRAHLERVLASMPLRVWRTDEVAVLSPHPNDPTHRQALDLSDTEFLTTFVIVVAPRTSSATLNALKAREAERTRELAEEGRLIRLWALAGHGRNLGLWQAKGSQAMQDILQSLPMADWLHVDTVQLSRHPNDPATGAHPTDAATADAVPRSTI